MPPLNVDLAKDNEETLEDAYQHRYAEAELRHKDWIFRHFVDYVSNNKRLGVNIRSNILLKFLTPNPSPVRASPYEKYKNYHTLVDEQVFPDDKNYNRRKEMEEMLGFGSEKKAIYYVMLSTGNEGIQRYGEYCLILKNEPKIVDNVSFLANDSYSYLFSYYGEPYRPFHIDRALWSNVEKLVAVKHFNAIVEREQPFSAIETDNLVLDAIRPDFIEGHLYLSGGGFTAQDIDEVRVSHKQMTRFLFLQTKHDIIGMSSKTEFSEYWTHKEILTLLESHRIKLVIV